MVEGRKAIAGSVACGITSIEDAVEGLNAVAWATVWWTLETTRRDRARWQALWLVRQARRAATKGHAGDARWWSDKAICALWNMN
jgi:hypothetical protein